jgi:oligopeptide/dipeptide ABC transporter ATP-binding protein
MCDQLAVMYAGRLVESGSVSRVFNAPAHPYTKALLNSIPRMSDRSQRLTAIAGQPPDLAKLTRGCAFAQRCPQVVERCRHEAPPAFPLGDGHMARCWLSPGIGAQRGAAAGAD